jgi:cytochrome c biogenesis protein CcdA
LDTFIVDLGMALWLGIMTSISPCPLATNIAAISYVGRKAGQSRAVLVAGILYTLGRMLTYVVVGVAVTASLMSIPSVSFFLQKYMNMLLGPLLIGVAIVLFGLVDFNFGWGGIPKSIQDRVDKAGVWGALLLGIVFALTFCPVSAALFFGSLIPLAVNHHSRILMPALYGIGTAVPVIVFAVVMAVSVQAVGKVFKRLTAIEVWIRRAMAAIFLGVGIYLTLKDTMGVF